MARDSLALKGLSLDKVGGMDESIVSTDSAAHFNLTGGAMPFFYQSQQRAFGKKIIDYNPGQRILAIHQTFNGVCLYGYFVETNNKVYYHVCAAPPDLRIRFVQLQ